jgi:hypothetical protein
MLAHILYTTTWGDAVFEAIKRRSIKMLNIARLLGLIVFALVMASGHAAASRSAIAQQIERQGYVARKHENAPPTHWEADTLGMLAKNTTWFRAKQSMGGEHKAYYCRFRLFEESYRSEATARARLRDIHRVTPEATAEEKKISPLRKGFGVGSKVYILATDGVIFESEVNRLVAKLVASNHGAEAAYGQVASPPNERIRP